MKPDNHVHAAADKPAVIMGRSGQVLRYGELVSHSRRCARLLRQLGLRRSDGIALMMDNRPEFFEICWAAQRLGLYYTLINWHLQPDEAAYILRDCEAKVLFFSQAVHPVLQATDGDFPALARRISVGGNCAGADRYEAVTAGLDDSPLDDETEGLAMIYSSGTTGRPKGIKRKLPALAFGGLTDIDQYLQARYGIGPATVYLSPAPLYHTAPFAYCMLVMRLGGTVVVMERFDALEALQLIERYRVNLTQMVPTHFVRLLKLPDAQRLAVDVSSLKALVHAAAPCPVEIKERMIQWLGPILYETYGATEGHGMTSIDSGDWLAHKGSVGRAVYGQLHILDAQGQELPPGRDGLVAFSGGGDFEYHNDPEQTARAKDGSGRSAVGDIGHVDSDGYLYLTDRASHMIISGGVNIYPQEVENALVLFEHLLDAAVIGVPNADLGEEVKAVVVLVDPARAGPEMAQRIIGHCRDRIAHYKCPRSVDFVAELPRLATGKLAKRLLREQYRKAPPSVH